MVKFFCCVLSFVFCGSVQALEYSVGDKVLFQSENYFLEFATVTDIITGNPTISILKGHDSGLDLTVYENSLQLVRVRRNGCVLTPHSKTKFLTQICEGDTVAQIYEYDLNGVYPTGILKTLWGSNQDNKYSRYDFIEFEDFKTMKIAFSHLDHLFVEITSGYNKEKEKLCFNSSPGADHLIAIPRTDDPPGQICVGDTLRYPPSGQVTGMYASPTGGVNAQIVDKYGKVIYPAKLIK